MEIEQILASAIPIIVSLFVGVISWSLRRLMTSYEEKLSIMAASFVRAQEKIDSAIGEIQKELQQVRVESALFKHTSGEVSRYADRIAALEKQSVLTDSKISAAFAVLTGKRKLWDEPHDV